MPSFFAEQQEEGSPSPATASRRSRTEWKLRKQFDYATHRREMVQSVRDAEQFFKEHLQFPKQRRKSSVVNNNSITSAEGIVSSSQLTIAEQRQIEDETVGDMHYNSGVQVTPAGGGFGPGYGSPSMKKTLEEKRSARDRLVQKVHTLEGYAATPGFITTVDPTSGGVKTVNQSIKEADKLKKKGNLKPFVDKARLFPPLRTKTIPTQQNACNDVVASTNNKHEGSMNNKSNIHQNETGATTKTLINNPDEEDLHKWVSLAAYNNNEISTSSTSSSRRQQLPMSSMSVSSLSKKIANQQTPTPLPPLVTNNNTENNKDEKNNINNQNFVTLSPRRGNVAITSSSATSTTSTTARNDNTDNTNSSCNLPPSLASPRNGLESLFTSARQHLKNAPIATAYNINNNTSRGHPHHHNYLSAAGGGGSALTNNSIFAGGRSRGSSRTGSRVQSRRASFVLSSGSPNSTLTNNNNNNNNTTSNDFLMSLLSGTTMSSTANANNNINLDDEDHLSGALLSSTMGSPKSMTSNSNANFQNHHHYQNPSKIMRKASKERDGFNSGENTTRSPQNNNLFGAAVTSSSRGGGRRTSSNPMLKITIASNNMSV